MKLIQYYFSMTDLEAELPISEDTASREPKEHPFIDLGGGMLGIIVSNPGDRFYLSGIFGEEGDEPETFTEAYLKTEDGNVYWLRKNNKNETAELVDSKKSREAGGNFYIESIDSQKAVSMSILIGEPLVFDETVLPNISQVYAVDKRVTFPQDEINRLSEGRKSNIIVDFVKASVPSQAQ